MESQVKVYKCEQCNKLYKSKSGLYNHNKRFHKIPIVEQPVSEVSEIPIPQVSIDNIITKNVTFVTCGEKNLKNILTRKENFQILEKLTDFNKRHQENHDIYLTNDCDVSGYVYRGDNKFEEITKTEIFNILIFTGINYHLEYVELENINEFQ